MSNTAFADRIRRHSMILVRRRQGVLPSGQPDETRNQGQSRAVHVVLVSVVTELRYVEITPGMTNYQPWKSCCGVEFAPYTVELVEWGTDYPDRVCVSKAGYPESFVSRMHREARDAILSRNASEEEMSTSIEKLGKLFTGRGPDWVQNQAGDEWCYEASFNGVFSSERLFPRGTDLGLEHLHVELSYPAEVHIHSCGIRDGCARHLARAPKHCHLASQSNWNGRSPRTKLQPHPSCWRTWCGASLSVTAPPFRCMSTHSGKLFEQIRGRNRKMTREAAPREIDSRPDSGTHASPVAANRGRTTRSRPEKSPSSTGSRWRPR